MNEELGGPMPEAQTPARGGDYPFWSFHDLLLLIGFALPVLVVSAVFTNMIAFMLPAGAVSPAASVLAAQFLGYGLWFLCLWGLIHWRYGRPFWESLGWTRPPHPMLVYVFLGPLLALSVAVVGVALRTPDIEMPMKQLMGDRFSLILIGCFAVTMGPLCEELAFRGFILPLLARKAGVAAGVLVTALAFSMLHGPQYAWSWRHILLITLAGVAFGVVRVRTGSTSAAAVMHATYNLTFFVGYLAQWDQMHM